VRDLTGSLAVFNCRQCWNLIVVRGDALIENFLADTKAVTPRPNPRYNPSAKMPPQNPKQNPAKKAAASTDQRSQLEGESDEGV